MLDLVILVWAVVLSWRFLLSAGVATVAIIFVFSVIPDRTVCAIVSFIIGLVACVVGFVWQYEMGILQSCRGLARDE